MEEIHFVFGHSAAATLKEALLSVGKHDNVINCWGDYHAGPLNKPAEDRIDWLCDHYYDVDGKTTIDLCKEYIERTSIFRRLCSGNDALKSIWYSRKCANDYCGYLESLNYLKSNPELIRIVELSAVPVKESLRPVSVGGARPEFFVEAFPFHRSLSEGELEPDLVLWSKLKDENAPLRVMSVEGLVSTDIDFFDNELLSFVSDEFQPLARVIGNVLCCVDYKKDIIQGNSDLFYFSRLRELSSQGKIEWRGSLNVMREAAIRLAP